MSNTGLSYGPIGHTQGQQSVSSSLADYSSMRNVASHHSPLLATVVESESHSSQLDETSTGKYDDVRPLQSTPPLSSPLQSDSRTLHTIQDSPTSSDVPSWGHSAGPSPATTPLTPQSSSNSNSPWDRAGEAIAKQQQLTTRNVKDQSATGRGFEPLSSLAPDTSYRSATLSIYGMYDDDDAPELKGLPLDDPRVSRHLSTMHGVPVSRVLC